MLELGTLIYLSFAALSVVAYFIYTYFFSDSDDDWDDHWGI